MGCKSVVRPHTITFVDFDVVSENTRVQPGQHFQQIWEDQVHHLEAGIADKDTDGQDSIDGPVVQHKDAAGIRYWSQ